jgi:transglutaminase-like putative cysteine protease
VIGAAEYKVVSVGSNSVVLVRPDAGKPFTITARVDFDPQSYETHLKQPPTKKLPTGIEAFLASTKGIDPNCEAVQKIVPTIKGTTIGATLRNLTDWVPNNIQYQIVFPGSADAVLRQRKGECGGRAMVFVALARASGIPASEVWRYVPIFLKDGPIYDAMIAHLTKHGADPALLRTKNFLCSHAWVEVYLPEYGWAMLDPAAPYTIGLLPNFMMKMRHFPEYDPDGYLDMAYANIGATGGVVANKELEMKKKR